MNYITRTDRECLVPVRETRKPGCGVARNFFGGDKTGVWGRNPSGIQVQNPGEGVGAKPHKMKTYMLITIATRSAWQSQT